MCQQWQISLIHVVRVLFRSTTNRPHVASQHAQQIHHVSPFPLRFSSISISLSFSHTYPPIHQVVDDSQYSSSDTLRAHHQQRGCFSAIPPLHERALSLMDDLSIGSRRLEGHALFFFFSSFQSMLAHTAAELTCFIKTKRRKTENTLLRAQDIRILVCGV